MLTSVSILSEINPYLTHRFLAFLLWQETNIASKPELNSIPKHLKYWPHAGFFDYHVNDNSICRENWKANEIKTSGINFNPKRNKFCYDHLNIFFSSKDTHVYDHLQLYSEFLSFPVHLHLLQQLKNYKKNMKKLKTWLCYRWFCRSNAIQSVTFDFQKLFFTALIYSVDVDHRQIRKTLVKH